MKKRFLTLALVLSLLVALVIPASVAMAAQDANVGMTATYTAPPVISITVLPTDVNFGAVVPGAPSSAFNVTVTNDGTVSEDLTASLTGLSDPDVYTTGLTINGLAVDVWGVATAVTVGIGADSGPLPLILTVPGATAPGTYTGTLVFWAIETP